MIKVKIVSVNQLDSFLDSHSSEFETILRDIKSGYVPHPQIWRVDMSFTLCLLIMYFFPSKIDEDFLIQRGWPRSFVSEILKTFVEVRKAHPKLNKRN